MTHYTDADRAAFEAWARGYGTWEVKRDDDVVLGTTGYTDLTLTVAWHAVQAAHRAPETPTAENIRDGAPYDNPEFEQLARDMGVWGTAQSAVCAQFWLAATQPAAQGMDAGKLLAEKHTGMKVDYRGLLGQVQREIERSAPGHAEMLRQLQGHLQELGQRWYAGDTAVVDELLQLYCVERQARAALAAQAKQGGASNG